MFNLTTDKLLYAQNQFGSLDSTLNAIYLQDKLPGLGVILVNKESMIYNKSFGYAKVEQHITFTSHTIQNIGSVSKTFIAVALLKAMEQGYFTLETNINDILPFQVTNPYFRHQQIKVKHLVTHTSGIIDNKSIYPRTYLFDTTGTYNKSAFELLKKYGYTGGITDTTLKEFMYAYLSKKGNLYSQNNFAKSKAGTYYHYSNIASALAGYLIEVKTGLSFVAYTQKYILQPLKMHHSGWHLNSIEQKLHFSLYYSIEQALPIYSLITYPEGGLRTCLADISQYLIEMIKGYYGTSNLLSPSSFQLMFMPRFSSIKGPKGLDLNNRNKGVFWNIYKGGTIGQDGDDPGVSTYLFFNPKTGIGGFFMTNIFVDKTKLIEVVEAYSTKLEK